MLEREEDGGGDGGTFRVTGLTPEPDVNFTPDELAVLHGAPPVGTLAESCSFPLEVAGEVPLEVGVHVLESADLLDHLRAYDPLVAKLVTPTEQPQP